VTSDLTISDVETEDVTAVVGGLAMLQMQALAAHDIQKVNTAGNVLRQLAEENPTQVRLAFLENQDAFKIAAMPDDMLDILELEVRDGTLFEPDGDDGWVEVDIDG
jgi:hypothetical protein